MSRIDHDIIWSNYFACRLIANCPICKKEIFFDDHQSKKSGWHRGHIISQMAGGPDILCNIMPICIDCNQAMKNKNLFTYLYEIGLINLERAKEFFAYQKKINQDFIPFCSFTTNYGQQCKRRKIRLSGHERPFYWFNPSSVFSHLKSEQFCKSHSPKTEPMLED